MTAAAASSSWCFRTAPAFRDGLEAGNRQQPGRDLRSSFEVLCVSPSLEEHLVDDFLCRRLIADKAHDEAEDAHMMAHVKQLERALVSVGHRLDQGFVRSLRWSRKC